MRACVHIKGLSLGPHCPGLTPSLYVTQSWGPGVDVATPRPSSLVRRMGTRASASRGCRAAGEERGLHAHTWHVADVGGAWRHFLLGLRHTQLSLDRGVALTPLPAPSRKLSPNPGCTSSPRRPALDSRHPQNVAHASQQGRVTAIPPPEHGAPPLRHLQWLPAAPAQGHGCPLGAAHSLLGGGHLKP